MEAQAVDPICELVALPDTPEWVAARGTGIGASEAADILGIYGTPYEWFMRRKGLMPPREETLPMRLGKAIQPFVIDEYCRATGEDVGPERMYRSVAWPWMLATPDGNVIRQRKGIEAKSMGGWRARRELGPEGSDQIPEAYVVQAHHQMAVCGFDSVDFPVIVEGGLVFFTVPRDEDLIEMIVEETNLAWQRLQSGVAPEPDFENPRTHDALKAVYRAVKKGETVQLTADVIAKWDAAKLMDKEASALAKASDLLKARIIAAMGNAEFGEFAGRRIKRSLIKIPARTQDAYEFVKISEPRGKKKKEEEEEDE